MPVTRSLLSVVLALAIVAPPRLASAADDKKPVHVKEYTKKDGTHVDAHDRGAPKAGGPPTATAERPAHESSVTPALVAVARDERGRIQRSDAARHAFARQTGYLNGRPGYVIDHIVPLACGGADAPGNMQWQSIVEGKAKDRWERSDCDSYRLPTAAVSPPALGGNRAASSTSQASVDNRPGSPLIGLSESEVEARFSAPSLRARSTWYYTRAGGTVRLLFVDGRVVGHLTPPGFDLASLEKPAAP
jgi:hypothetical protein